MKKKRKNLLECRSNDLAAGWGRGRRSTGLIDVLARCGRARRAMVQKNRGDVF